MLYLLWKTLYTSFNDLRRGILEKQRLLGKSQKRERAEPSFRSPFQKQVMLIAVKFTQRHISKFSGAVRNQSPRGVL